MGVHIAWRVALFAALVTGLLSARVLTSGRVERAECRVLSDADGCTAKVALELANATLALLVRGAATCGLRAGQRATACFALSDPSGTALIWPDTACAPPRAIVLTLAFWSWALVLVIAVWETLSELHATHSGAVQ